MILFVSLIAALTGLPQQSAANLVKGPGVACGASFAIELKAGESLSWNDPQMDFIGYEFEQAGRGTILYAGNAPQPGGVVIETGLDWPAKIVVHGSPEIAKRIVIGTRAATLCPTKAAK
ncbi:MAG: hypothetical protein V4574_08565 [Pseudomonadota bacterium]